jgi:hypothetical protein
MNNSLLKSKHFRYTRIKLLTPQKHDGQCKHIPSPKDVDLLVKMAGIQKSLTISNWD